MDAHEPASRHPSGPPLTQRLAAWGGILGVPAIWTLHLLVSVTLIAAACAGGVVQRNALSWPTVETVVRVMSALAFAVALVGTVFAWRAWYRAAHAAHAYAKTDAYADAPVTGDTTDHGKHRFLTLCGAMASAGFTIGLVFTASVLIAASPTQLCEPFR